MIHIVRTNSNNPDFHALIRELDQDLYQKYGHSQSELKTLNHIEDLDTVIVVYDDDKAIGCGCFKTYNFSSAEIKRIFLRPEYRGKGIAHSLVTELELWIKESGFQKAILETGIGQPEAIRLYTKMKYQQIPNYGAYIGRLSSVCMDKILT